MSSLPAGYFLSCVSPNVEIGLGIAPVVGAAVRQADALDADACGHFEPNPFRALICRNCNKAKAKH